MKFDKIHMLKYIRGDVMKKIILFVIMSFAVLGLVACKKDTDSPVVISKVFDATLQANNIIELYNPSENAIDLKDYILNFYTNGSTEVTQTINLSGTIAAQSYFAIGSSNSNNTEVKSKYDMSYAEGSLPFNGNDGIELNAKNKVVDFVGLVGLDVDYSKDLTMIRLGEKEDYKPSTTFDMFSFIYYLPDMFDYLKNDDHEIKTLEDIYQGPRLEEQYLELPFLSPSDPTVGGGGAILTSNSGVADGDTATFVGTSGFSGGSVRYYYINTPEVDGSNVDAEPWGYVASKYNKEYLLNSPHQKEIRIQSIPGVKVQETYNRSLGLVWINGHLSQFLIVREGLSAVPGQYSAADYLLTYKNVPYLTFLRFAENRAKQNGWGVFGYPTNPDGEHSPDWNFVSNTNTTTNPVWTPHFESPWL